MVKKVETLQQAGEREAQQVRIQELENDLQRYRATVDAQLGLLPAAGGSSAPVPPPRRSRWRWTEAPSAPLRRLDRRA